MKIWRNLAPLCAVLVSAGCSNGRATDSIIVIRCETSMVDVESGRIAKYRPVEIVAGEIVPEMVDEDGNLRYTRALEPNQVVGAYYIFRIRKVPDVPGLSATNYPFGFNCEIDIELEL